MDRRELLTGAVSAGAVSMLTTQRSKAAEATKPSLGIVDTNVSLFRWPFRRLPLDDAAHLAENLEMLGVTQAWAGSFEGVLQRDVTGVNERLAEKCAEHPLFIPIGSINLELPDWELDLRRCIETYQMPGIRLHPNYHGYTLADARVADLLGRLASSGRFVQIAVAMEDIRTQHPLVQVPDVELAPLPPLIKRTSNVNVQLLNYRGRSGVHEELLKTSNLFFDCARVDGTDSIARLIRSSTAQRVLYGSHAPFLIPEASLIRTQESQLTETELDSLLRTASLQVQRSNG